MRLRRVLLSLFLVLRLIKAEDCQIILPKGYEDSPTPPERPLQIELNFMVDAVMAVDDLSRTFSLDLM